MMDFGDPELDLSVFSRSMHRWRKNRPNQPFLDLFTSQPLNLLCPLTTLQQRIADARDEEVPSIYAGEGCASTRFTYT